MNKSAIIQALPFGREYAFVDKIVHIDQGRVDAKFTFPKYENAPRLLKTVYQNHFPDNPIIPGVLLIECMAQIGLGCLGQIQKSTLGDTEVFLTDSTINFSNLVRPGDCVTVTAVRSYWRFGKLKVEVKMIYENNGKRIAEGTLAGMARPTTESNG